MFVRVRWHHKRWNSRANTYKYVRGRQFRKIGQGRTLDNSSHAYAWDALRSQWRRWSLPREKSKEDRIEWTTGQTGSSCGESGKEAKWKKKNIAKRIGQAKSERRTSAENTVRMLTRRSCQQDAFRLTTPCVAWSHRALCHWWKWNTEQDSDSKLTAVTINIVCLTIRSLRNRRGVIGACGHNDGWMPHIDGYAVPVKRWRVGHYWQPLYRSIVMNREGSVRRRLSITYWN